MAAAAGAGRRVVRIRPAAPEDGAALAAIYAPYVLDTPISLEAEPPDAAEMARRIADGGDLYRWLVCEVEGEAAGYAYAGRFRAREGYRFTAETSVYVAAALHRRGVARALYTELLDLLIAQGFTRAIAGVTLPNAASIGLHEAFGFTACGVYGRVGWKFGAWWDVGQWQRPLAPERTPPPEPLPLSALPPRVPAPPSRSAR